MEKSKITHINWSLMITVILTQLYFSCVQNFLVLRVFFLETLRADMPSIKYHVIICPFSIFLLLLSGNKENWPKIAAVIVSAAYCITFLSPNIVHSPIQTTCILLLYVAFGVISFFIGKFLSGCQWSTNIFSKHFFLNISITIISIVILIVVVFCNMYIMP